MIVRAIVALALLVPVAGWSCRAQTAESAEAVPVRASETVPADGAALYLLTRGADRHAPVLLWLHGGPGGAERPLFRYFNGALENDFVVAYWDQRGAGRSFDPDADPRALTVARHLADLDLVVDHLRRTYARDRIVLVGHSWGGMLGLLYAREHAEKVAALVLVAPLIATAASQESEHAFVAEEAARRGDLDAQARLDALGPPPYETAKEVLALEQLSDRYGAVYHTPPSRMWTLTRGILGGLVTPWEIPDLIRGNEVSIEAMTPELLGVDVRMSVPRVEVPVTFALGRHDRHVDARIAAAYYEQLGAPSKKLVWFEESAHNVPFEEAEEFNEMIGREADSE